VAYETTLFTYTLSSDQFRAGRGNGRVVTDSLTAGGNAGFGGDTIRRHLQRHYQRSPAIWASLANQASGDGNLGSKASDESMLPYDNMPGRCCVTRATTPQNQNESRSGQHTSTVVRAE